MAGSDDQGQLQTLFISSLLTKIALVQADNDGHDGRLFSLCCGTSSCKCVLCADVLASRCEQIICEDVAVLLCPGRGWCACVSVCV